MAIVNRGMANRYWPGDEPLGKRIRLTDGAWAEIVGVAADAKFRLFTSNSTPFLYLPHQQNPSTRATLVVRTEAESEALASELRTTIHETDRAVPILSMRTMEAFYYANAQNLNTVVVRTIAGMGTMGLVLALVGLYGLTAYAVSRRTREIGIRIAVGAVPTSVLRMILRQGITALGRRASLAGVFASVGGRWPHPGRLSRHRADTITYLLIVPVVVVVVMLAAYIPARRAARIDPLMALRQD